MTEVRVRFAPSPTGPLHIGGVRTALYNYLFARKNKGTMILRIEDTDQTRFVKGAESYIIDALAWCGIEFDEGVHVGGKFAPYRQSDRKEMYRKYADELISNGFAYYAFDTPEELDTFRKDFESQKKTFTYDSSIRMNLNNSLKLGEEESQKLISSGIPYVIRFKMPENEIIQMDDLIRGHIQVNTNTLDDKVLFKSDGMPTYHLANVVDDHLMEISHVIRGEEWLPSMPLHIMLYRAFGWQDTKPAFAHLPLLLKPEGNGKLSKRDGDRLGFPVFPTEWNNQETGEKSSGYREEGYIPEAFINMMALLGWNPGTEQEIFSMNELIENFSLERVNKSGARFDPEKAKWFNHQYILKSDDGVLAADFVMVVKNKGFDLDYEKARHMIGLVKERVHFAKELWSQTSFFFIAPDKYDETALKKRWKTESPELMLKLKEKLENNPDFSASSTEQYIKTWIENEGLNLGAIMNAFRICLVGELKGPHLFDIVEMIGKEETLKRISIALETIKL